MPEEYRHGYTVGNRATGKSTPRQGIAMRRQPAKFIQGRNKYLLVLNELDGQRALSNTTRWTGNNRQANASNSSGPKSYIFHAERTKTGKSNTIDVVSESDRTAGLDTKKIGETLCTWLVFAMPQADFPLRLATLASSTFLFREAGSKADGMHHSWLQRTAAQLQKTRENIAHLRLRQACIPSS